MGVRLTAHNGRGNKNGAFNVNHNEEYFSDFIQERNKKSISEAHPERCQNIQSYRKSRKSCPEETIFCVGRKDNTIDNNLMKKILVEHLNWRKKNFPQIQFLDVAFHVDENGVGHAHERHCYLAKDEKTNNYCVNQKKSLEQMNVQRPDISKKEDRYNNAKTTFTKLCRENLFSICEKYGVEVIREPKHKSKVGKKLDDYIAENRKNELDKRENQLDIREKNLNEKEKIISNALSDIAEFPKHIKSVKNTFNKAINSKTRDERNYYAKQSTNILSALADAISNAANATTMPIYTSNRIDWDSLTDSEKEELLRKLELEDY